MSKVHCGHSKTWRVKRASSEFRRENIRPPQKPFRKFVLLYKSWELVGGELIAVDGTKS